MAEKKKKKKKKFIQDAIKRPGAFTAKADKYDERTVKQARLRKTLVGLNKKKKSKK